MAKVLLDVRKTSQGGKTKKPEKKLNPKLIFFSSFLKTVL